MRCKSMAWSQLLISKEIMYTPTRWFGLVGAYEEEIMVCDTPVLGYMVCIRMFSA